jgi:transcriptional regulator with XRE-family HTH domain
MHPVAAARRRERYSLRALAEITGIGFRTIHRIERGAARPSPLQARLLAAALRIPLSELLSVDAAPEVSL